MNVYRVDRTDNLGWNQDYTMVVVAQDELHAERCARKASENFEKAPLKIVQIDLTQELAFW